MWKKLTATVAFTVFSALACAAPASPWPDAPFSYYANNAKLEHVLREFGGNFSLSVQLTPAVSGSVNGRFNTANPTEFINRLGSIYGFNWFTYAGTLYVSKSTETVTRGISALGANIGSARDALTSLGVIDARFGWGELPEQGVALVSGPPAYVDLVERTIKSLPLVAGGQQIAVFRLRHASVDDRTILYRDREITTPGLATVIRNLFSGGGATGVTNTTLNALAAPLKAAAPLVEDGPPPVASDAPAKAVSVNKQGRATIQADSRINALIVQDIPERLPIYERLIRELDIPTALIEIEALIIDVNSDKLKELGIAWGGRVGKTAIGYGNLNNSDANAISIGAAVSGAINPTTLLVDAGNYLVSRVHALEGVGDAHIQSSPSILTIDNVGALLDLSETFYIRTMGERVASVTPVTAGTTLKVTPRYLPGDGAPAIQLTVDIEDGQIQDRQVDTLPTVRRSVVSTQAIVGENQTLLIGGYNTQARSERVEGVPVLSKIPILGLLFSNRTSNVQKRERLFMIKPKIISLPTVAQAVPADTGTVETLPEPRNAAPPTVRPSGLSRKGPSHTTSAMPALSLPPLTAVPAQVISTPAVPGVGKTTVAWVEDPPPAPLPQSKAITAGTRATPSAEVEFSSDTTSGAVTGLTSSSGDPVRIGAAHD